MFKHRNPSDFQAGFREPDFGPGVRLLNSVDGNGPMARLISEPELPEVAEDSAEDVVNIIEVLASPGEVKAPAPPDFSARSVAFGAVVRAVEDSGSDPELAGESADLLSILRDAEERICALVSLHRKRHFERLSERHESARAAARTALDTFKATQLEAGPVEGLLRRARENTGKCRVEIRSWEDSKPRPETFPTRLELLDWQRGLEDAQKELEAASEKERDIAGQLTDIAGRLRAQRAELQKLAQAEEDLRTALSGKPVRDREFGLYVSAEKF